MVPNTNDGKFGIYLLCSRAKGTIIIFACVIACRNMYFQGVKNYTGFSLPFSVVFLWYNSEVLGIYDFSLFETQEAGNSCLEKSHAIFGACL